MLSFSVARGAVLALIAASAVLAQVTPSVSTDPLGGSTFTTPFFSPTQTYTITSTFPTAASRTLVTISGAAGPSPATEAYTYTYSAPDVSQTMTPLDSLFSSLAANGEPTAYTNPFQPDLKNMQFADGASSSLPSMTALMATIAAGAAVGAFYL